MNAPQPGSIVRCRGREWVLLPSSDEQLAVLRPLTGSERETCTIYLPLSKLDRSLDAIEEAHFPPPTPDDAGDALGAELLWNAARLTLREGAGPFRSLGRVSFRPRAYQFVPLLMALRQESVRLLIADDVGIGKTMEALLIAREMLDRGVAQRLCVLCPPYLCDQWQTELWDKFGLQAVVVRSGTVGQLERELPSAGHSVFGYYPITVVSIDYAKSERHKPNFLQHCPELVIVDEAHGAAQPTQQARGQQQRHELLRAVAADPQRHLLMLTATPHSGIEASFRSLLGLLRPEFERWDLQALSERHLSELARHFVQRRRADIQRWMGEDTPFPQRVSSEAPFVLSPEYLELFQRVFQFSRGLVRSAETLTGWKRRIRYWSALALLRCVMSSPAAAQAAIQARVRRLGEGLSEDEASDEAFAPYVHEPGDEEAQDVQPAHIVEASLPELSEGESRALRGFARLAERLEIGDGDAKVAKCAQHVARLLKAGCQPIVWCRYIATSDYVAEQFRRRLPALLPSSAQEEARIVSITGALSEDERRERIEELVSFPRRVLVATDCLSEGINLQAGFNAVLHYDLPWNPNRLEQREGRVDRFGQTAPQVEAILLYGSNNPVDGAVLEVLLRKAREIHKLLGISVPVPQNSETVMEAVLQALFFRAPKPDQPLLPGLEGETRDLHKQWDQAAEREKTGRTRFAQRAIKPGEVQRELEETDAVLGDPETVQRFVLNACQRLGAEARPAKVGTWLIEGLAGIPEFVQECTPEDEPAWRVAFHSPTPEGATYLGRNHPFVAALAQYLLEDALAHNGQAKAARCGAVRTRAVERRTVLLLLRLRFLLQTGGPGKASTTPSQRLAEEVLACAFRGAPGAGLGTPVPDAEQRGPGTITPPQAGLGTPVCYRMQSPPKAGLEWLPDEEALRLLAEARADAPISGAERREVLGAALDLWPALQPDVRQRVEERGQRLAEAHRRVRASAGLSEATVDVKPQWPPDLLGTLVLLPIPPGIGGHRESQP